MFGATPRPSPPHRGEGANAVATEKLSTLSGLEAYGPGVADEAVKRWLHQYVLEYRPG